MTGHMHQQENSYVKRQMSILGNLGLFYLIILALFAVPLVGTAVIVLIKGMVDFRYAILITGIICTGLAVFFIGRYAVHAIRKIRTDGFAAKQDADNTAGNGNPVQIAFLNGLITINYGGSSPATPMALLPDNQQEPFQLPENPQPATSNQQPEARNPQPATPDIISRLESLSRLKHAGDITEHEFLAIKKKMLDDGGENEKED